MTTQTMVKAEFTKSNITDDMCNVVTRQIRILIEGKAEADKSVEKNRLKMVTAKEIAVALRKTYENVTLTVVEETLEHLINKRGQLYFWDNQYNVRCYRLTKSYWERVDEARKMIEDEKRLQATQDDIKNKKIKDEITKIKRAITNAEKKRDYGKSEELSRELLELQSKLGGNA